MEKRRIRLTPMTRRMFADAVMDAPDGWYATIQPPTKSRDQEAKYHAMLKDIAEQTQYLGRSWDLESMKRILLNEFEEEMRKAGTPLAQSGQMIPTEDGARIIQLGVQSRQFRVAEAAQFIEFLYAWGSDRSVVWSEEAHIPGWVRP